MPVAAVIVPVLLPGSYDTGNIEATGTALYLYRHLPNPTYVKTLTRALMT